MAELLDVRIYNAPNPALASIMISPRMRAIVRDVTELGEAIYREEVAKRTGRLAADTHVGTERGGVYSDRWVGVLTVGTGAAREYALSHEFGSQYSQGETAGERWVHPEQGPANDLNRVLEILSVASYL